MTNTTRKPLYRRWLLLVATLLIMLWAYLSLRVPSNEAPWSVGHERTPHLEFDGRDFSVRDVRDFRYGPDRQPIKLDYDVRRYNLDDIRRAWFGLSHFGPGGLAHAFLSFEFEHQGKQSFLVYSLEARLRPDENYGLVAGLLRRFTKIAVYASEQDVIGLRSHLRGETVLLYPVVTETLDGLEELFMALADDTNALHEQAAFYNTFIDNCLTNVLKHSDILSHVGASDLDVLLPGRSDRLTYYFDITPSDIPFEEARQRATVKPVGDIDDPNFSQLLRCGWNGYQDLRYPACD